MVIHLPARLDRISAYDLLSRIANSDGRLKDRSFDFDFKYLQFVEPSGVTFLSNLLEWLEIHRIEWSLIVPEEKRLNYKRECPIHYLGDSQFFARYAPDLHLSRWSARNTTMPLQIVACEGSCDWLNNTFSNWLGTLLGHSPEVFENVRMCLAELFNNINDHAGQKLGCIYSQYYPNLDVVNISLSDFGTGIPNTVRTKYPALDDSEAILRATDEGFTTKSRPANRGAGLHNLLRTAVVHFSGKVYIHSGMGILECSCKNNDLGRTPSISKGYYPGTLIELVLSTRRISEDIQQNAEVFSWF